MQAACLPSTRVGSGQARGPGGGRHIPSGQTSRSPGPGAVPAACPSLHTALPNPTPVPSLTAASRQQCRLVVFSTTRYMELSIVCGSVNVNTCADLCNHPHNQETAPQHPKTPLPNASAVTLHPKALAMPAFLPSFVFCQRVSQCHSGMVWYVNLESGFCFAKHLACHPHHCRCLPVPAKWHSMGMGHRVLVPSPRDRVALSPALADYEDNCC